MASEIKKEDVDKEVEKLTTLKEKAHSDRSDVKAMKAYRAQAQKATELRLAWRQQEQEAGRRAGMVATADHDGTTPEDEG